MSGLAQIRLLEAVSFRSFPATTTHYDGTWAIRMTAGHAAKRLNSVNPLDPQDSLDLEGRIKKAEHRFSSFGRPLNFRLTPLAPPQLSEIFRASGWEMHEESIVMMLDLENLEFANVQDQLPLQDIGRWVDDFIDLSGDSKDLKPGFVEVIGATQPKTGLFLRTNNEGDKTASMVRCVCDQMLAGVFDLVSSPDMLREGHARSIAETALLWAKRNNAKKAWLQVVADNKPANALYESLGFREIYRYRYWKPGKS